MKPSSNIDLLLTLNTTGWSVAHISIDNNVLEYSISHIFNDPYADTIDALLSLIEGYDSSVFWFDEPYGVKIKLTIEEEDFIRFTIYNIDKESYTKIKKHDLIFVKSCGVDLKHLLMVFYFQFKKICVLLEDKEYAINRSRYFPIQKFRQFEAIIKKNYKIK